MNSTYRYFDAGHRDTKTIYCSRDMGHNLYYIPWSGRYRSYCMYGSIDMRIM